MGQVQLANNAYTTVSTALTNVATTLTVAASTTFPAVTTASGNWFYACLQDTFANMEIVKVTNVSGTTWTITRAIGGTTARAFVSGSVVELRVTAETLTDVQASNNAGQLLGSTWAVPPVIGSTTPNDANFTSVNGGQLAGLRNHLINGGMQVGQRGSTVFSSSNNLYGWVDRWLISISGTTVSALGYQAADTTASTGTCLQVGNVTTTGATVVAISQRIEVLNALKLQGKTVTFSGKVKQVTGSTQTVTVSLSKNVSGTPDVWGTQTNLGFNNISLSSNVWTPFSLTLAIGSTDAIYGLAVAVAFNSLGSQSSTQFYLADCQLEIGSVATPFEQRPYGMELALCQRYYETGNFYFAAYGVNGVGAAGNTSYKVTKRATLPSIGLNVTTNLNISSAPININTVDQWSFLLQPTAAGGYAYYGTWTSSSEL